MNTVLVVDDTAMFRDPIVVTLRREGFEVISASNGQEALDFLKTRIVDLILLDVTMPVMDGLTCLRELRKDVRMSHVPVIMLSAMSERNVVVQAAQVGVQGYLLKSSFSKAHLLEMIARFLPVPPMPVAGPLRSPVRIPSVVQNSLSTTESAKRNSSFLKQIVDKIRLRSISPVLQQVLVLAEDRNTGPEDLVVMIRQDPALALRVLKIANSSFYSSAKRVQNLTEAAQRLGTQGIRNAAAAVSAIEHFGDATSCGLTPQRFWEHSLATATLAQSIAESVRMEEPEKLFLTGLFHDVGRMAMAITSPERCNQAICMAEQRGVDLIEAEKEIFDIDHIQIGVRILQEWKMPASIIEPIKLHGLTVAQIIGSTAQPGPAIVLSLANKLAHSAMLGNSGNAILAPLQDCTEHLQLSDEKVDAMVCSTVEKLQEISLFYASQADQAFRGSFATELAQASGLQPQIITTTCNQCNAVALCVRQMGWQDNSDPQIAIVDASNTEDFQTGFRKLQQVEARQSRRLAVLLVAGPEEIDLPTEFTARRDIAFLRLPCGYRNLIAQIKSFLLSTEAGEARLSRANS